jgi:hypothetical protein
MAPRFCVAAQPGLHRSAIVGYCYPDLMPRKVREVIKQLENAGWVPSEPKAITVCFDTRMAGSRWYPGSSQMMYVPAPTGRFSNRLKS